MKTEDNGPYTGDYGRTHWQQRQKHSYTKQSKTKKKTTRPKGVKMPPAGLQICLWPHVTLTSDLLILKVNLFMSREPLVSTGIKSGAFVFKIVCLQLW